MITKYRSFVRARAWVRRQNLENHAQWRLLCQGKLEETHGLLPEDIPASPETIYPEFEGYGDWLGTGTVAKQFRTYRAWPSTRKFARSLELESRKQWELYAAGLLPGYPPRPSDIPSRPDRAYPDNWQGWKDFLGTEDRVRRWGKWRPMEDARQWVHNQNFSSRDEWENLCAGRLEIKLPDDIPSRPDRTYGHLCESPFDWSDWLGITRTHSRGTEPAPFKKARAFVKGLKLSGKVAFKEWSRGDRPDLPRRPNNIPGSPDKTYSKTGEWKGWAHFLGKPEKKKK